MGCSPSFGMAMVAILFLSPSRGSEWALAWARAARGRPLG